MRHPHTTQSQAGNFQTLRTQRRSRHWLQQRHRLLPKKKKTKKKKKTLYLVGICAASLSLSLYLSLSLSLVVVDGWIAAITRSQVSSMQFIAFF
jgi:hypothetical protein